MVKLATVLAGAEPASKRTFNATYRGQILLEDGETQQAVIKDLDERQLLNELFVSSIGQSLNLPMPVPYLAIASPDRLDLKKGPQVDGGRLCFASADVQQPNLTFQLEAASSEAEERLYSDLQSWKGISATVAFDTWVANVDRNGGNLLVGGEDQFWLIDHGHCLTGENWKPSDFIEDKQYRNILADWLRDRLENEELEQKSKEVDAFVADIMSVRVGSCRKDSLIETFLSAMERDAAESFLDSRRPHVSKCAKSAMGAERLV